MAATRSWMTGARWWALAAGWVLGLCWSAVAMAMAGAQEAPSPPPLSAVVPEKSVQAWLARWHEASCQRAYIGTFVVSSGGDMAASKIWHVCDGTQQLERIETLSGAPRTTLRRNDEVVTFYPDTQVALRERREALRLFPARLRHPGSHIDSWYSARVVGQERVAGFEALVVDFVPRDALRYSHRVWSEKNTGLVLQWQTRGGGGQVLEQVAFTELQLDAPLKPQTLARQMDGPPGYQVVRPDLRKTPLEAEGWRLRQDVAGFRAMGCQVRQGHQVRQAGPAKAGAAVQCVFSDGVASLSLFWEPFDAQRHAQAKALTTGATHTLSRRLGEHWVTALGEVPHETLVVLVQALERTR